MNLLVSVTRLAERMVVDPNLPGSETAFISALRAAQLRAESELETRFEQGSYSDTFLLDDSIHSGVVPNGVFRLQLKNGLLRSDPAPTLFSGSKWRSASDPVSSDLWTIDYLRGLVSVDESLRNKYIRVNYDAGFTADEAESGETIPDFLTEAILGYAPIMFLASQVTNRNEEAEPGYKAALEHAIGILIPYRRRSVFAIRPVF